MSKRVVYGFRSVSDQVASTSEWPGTGRLASHGTRRALPSPPGIARGRSPWP